MKVHIKVQQKFDGNRFGIVSIYEPVTRRAITLYHTHYECCEDIRKRFDGDSGKAVYDALEENIRDLTENSHVVEMEPEFFNGICAKYHAAQDRYSVEGDAFRQLDCRDAFRQLDDMVRSIVREEIKQERA